MKLAASILSSFLLSTSLVMGAIECKGSSRALGSGEDVEGEASIKTGGCKLKCEWGVNAERRLRSKSRNLLLELPHGRHLGKEVDGVEVAFVDCTLTYEDIEYTKSLPFPEGWTEVFKAGDDASDYYGLATEFTLDLGDVEGLGSKCSVSAELEIELVVEEDEEEKEFLVYDDQDIGVSC